MVASDIPHLVEILTGADISWNNGNIACKFSQKNKPCSKSSKSCHLQGSLPGIYSFLSADGIYPKGSFYHT